MIAGRYNPKSYLALYNSQEIIFRRPTATRWIGALMTPIFGLFMVLPAVIALEGHAVAPVWFIFNTVVFGPFFVAALRDACPLRLRFDLTRHSYSLRDGFPPFARTVTGSLQDVKQLRSFSVYSKAERHRIYTISLVWRRRRRETILARTMSQEEAEHLIQRYTNIIGLSETGANYYRRL